MVISHNMQALLANGYLSTNNLNQSKSTKKLSSGYRINSAADDAAALSISEKMRWQIRGLNKASSNAQEGIALVNVADGALSEVDAMLDRCKELAVQAANDTNTDADRSAIQQEINQLYQEIDRINDTTQYNTLNLFSTEGLSPDSLGDKTANTGSVNAINITWDLVDDANNKIDSVSATDQSGKATAYGPEYDSMIQDVTDAAAQTVNKLSSLYPGLFASASTSGIKVGLNIATMDGSGRTLASASLSMGGTDTGIYTAYTMNVDLADFNPTSYDRAKLKATVAHEMTHLVMFDSVTRSMYSGNEKSFPQWFIEGMAQTSSGDNGWLSGTLNPSSSDNAIKSYMSQISSMPYGAGYLGCMYLGYAASGSTTVDSASIASGLDKILTSVAGGKSLDQAIAENTSFTSTSDFTSKFKSADADAFAFVKNYLNARGTTGEGSLLAALSTPKANIFDGISNPAGNYAILSDNTQYKNTIDGVTFSLPPKASSGTGSGANLKLQVGDLKGQTLDLIRFDVSAKTLLGTETLTVSDSETAGDAITKVDDAIQRVSRVRAYYGAMTNRLEHTVSNLNNTSENTSSAESKLRDTDMADEMVAYSTNNILLQAAQSMLAQANSSPQGVLKLLQ